MPQIKNARPGVKSQKKEDLAKRPCLAALQQDIDQLTDQPIKSIFSAMLLYLKYPQQDDINIIDERSMEKLARNLTEVRTKLQNREVL